MLQNGAQRLRAEKKHMQQHLHSGRSAAWFGNVAPGLCGIEPGRSARPSHALRGRRRWRRVRACPRLWKLGSMKVDTSEFLTVAVFGLATLLIARAGWRHRHNGRASDSLPWTWLALRAYSESTDPRHNPRRHPSGEAIYSRYKAWIQERGLDNHGYIVRYHDCPGVALAQ
jgi:hypothetical protein